MKQQPKEQPKEESKEQDKNQMPALITLVETPHLGSSNAFEETENPLSGDPDHISDEKLDELLGG